MAYPSVQDGFNAAYGQWSAKGLAADLKPRAIAWHFYNQGLQDEVTMTQDTRLSGAPDVMTTRLREIARAVGKLDNPALDAAIVAAMEPVKAALLKLYSPILEAIISNPECGCTVVPPTFCLSCKLLLEREAAVVTGCIEALAAVSNPVVVGVDPAKPGSDRTSAAVVVGTGDERKTYPIPEGYRMLNHGETIRPGDRAWYVDGFVELAPDHWLNGLPATPEGACIIRKVGTV